MMVALLVGLVGGGGTTGYFWNSSHQAAVAVQTELEAKAADAEGRAVAAERRAALLTVQVQLSQVNTELAQRNFGTATEHLAEARKAAEAARVEPIVAELNAIDLGVTTDVAVPIRAVTAASEHAAQAIAAP